MDAFIMVLSFSGDDMVVTARVWHVNNEEKGKARKMCRNCVCVPVR